MRVFDLTYRRPALVKKLSHQGSNSLHSVKSTSCPGGIPDAISFDRILQGGTCPPCTIRDFMNYLIYVERSAENLQFFLCLSQEWTTHLEEQAILRLKKQHADIARQKMGKKAGSAADIFKGTDFEKSDHSTASNPSVNVHATAIWDPFSTPPATPQDLESPQPQSSGLVGSTMASYTQQASHAYASAGVDPPFSVQPHRQEIDRIIATYLMEGSPRQLNLSDMELKVTIQALAYTTHPSAFRLILSSVESTLRQQSHSNFIRWSICNGNPLRVVFATTLGVVIILLITVVAILLTLSEAPKGFRALAAFGWFIGIATLIAACKGMLHGLHHQHIRPWELFDISDEELSEMGESRTSLKDRSFDHFGGGNSFETEPWVVKYKQRSVIRKIFDREVWIQEPALRQIQDAIFVQSVFVRFDVYLYLDGHLCHYS